MAEWSKAHDWKSCVRPMRTEGSNPSLSAIYNKPAFVAGFAVNCGIGGLEPEVTEDAA